MRAHNTSKKASVPVEIEFTDKPMIPYGAWFFCPVFSTNFIFVHFSHRRFRINAPRPMPGR